MMDFMNILVKRILKTLLNIYDGAYVMMGFPYELFCFPMSRTSAGEA